jgi:hypothetical protein
MDPTCLDFYDELQCWMYDVGRCGTCIREKPEKSNSKEKAQKSKQKEKNA